MLKECLLCLLGLVRDPNHSDIILNILTEVSGYDPTALAAFLPELKEIGESFPHLIGQTAKIFGAVGRVDEVIRKLKGWAGWFSTRVFFFVCFFC